MAFPVVDIGSDSIVARAAIAWSILAMACQGPSVLHRSATSRLQVATVPIGLMLLLYAVLDGAPCSWHVHNKSMPGRRELQAADLRFPRWQRFTFQFSRLHGVGSGLGTCHMYSGFFIQLFALHHFCPVFHHASRAGPDCARHPGRAVKIATISLHHSLYLLSYLN